MARRLWFIVVAVSGLACFVLSARDFAGERASLITVDSSGISAATVWRYDEATRNFVAAWQPTPLFMDKATYASGSRDIPSGARSFARPLIADSNGDGVNELLVVDGYGITVYGSSPAYFPFSAGGYEVQLAVSDLDGDGSPELITQRTLSSGTPTRRRIDIWKREGEKLRSLWSRDFEGGSYVLLLADTDNDGQKELITASDTIVIMKQKAPPNWEVSAELPNIGLPRRGDLEFTMIDVVRVADVDNDGRNEILATGNSGMLTVYRYKKQSSGREAYPVLWQSEWLDGKDLQPPPYVYSQGLAVADINSDQKLEILVATTGLRIPPNGEKGKDGQIHIFTFDGRRGFVDQVLPDRTLGIPAFSVGDIDGDGINEFVYNGREVYGYNKTSSKYELRATLPFTTSTTTVVGTLPALREPSDAVRIVPVRWTLPRGSIRLGETANISISLKSVWATAKDVTVELRSESPLIRIKNGVLRIGDIAGGTTAASPDFALGQVKPNPIPKIDPANGDLLLADLQLVITAAGGYRQSIPLSVNIVEK